MRDCKKDVSSIFRKLKHTVNKVLSRAGIRDDVPCDDAFNAGIAGHTRNDGRVSTESYESFKSY
jgi:hypothetical protein